MFGKGAINVSLAVLPIVFLSVSSSTMGSRRNIRENDGDGRGNDRENGSNPLSCTPNASLTRAIRDIVSGKRV